MSDSEAARAQAIAGVQAIFERYKAISSAQKDASHFDKHVMENLKIIDASPAGSATFEFFIDESYTNLNGVMHGGAAALIFDMATTSAQGPLARPGFWDFMGGVTRTLNISYLQAIPARTKVRIHSHVLRLGRTMSMIRGEMTSLDGKTIYCTCEHHKVGVPTQAEHLKYRIGWDELWEKDGKAKL